MTGERGRKGRRKKGRKKGRKKSKRGWNKNSEKRRPTKC